MKRQISICILLAVIVILLALFYIKLQNETGRSGIPNDVENTEIELTSQEDNTQSVTSSKEYKTYYFYAKESDGQISIYDVKTQTLYMETGILLEQLPEELCIQLEAGIYFENEEQLYSFLESYSS